MKSIKRLEVHPIKTKSNSKLIDRINKYLKLDLNFISSAKVYWICSDKKTDDLIEMIKQENILHDPITEKLITHPTQQLDTDSILQIKFKPGVTDNEASATGEAINLVDPTHENLSIFTGKLYFFKGDLTQKQIETIGHEFLGNKLLNTFECFSALQFKEHLNAKETLPFVKMQTHKIEHFNLDQKLETLMQDNIKNCWALSETEMQQIIDHYKSSHTQKHRKEKGLSIWPTDVEMEVIAQSWSEHCKHKIFAAHINYSESEPPEYKSLGHKKVKSLYKSYIKKATYDIKEKHNLDWLISVFSDNAGIVRFDDDIDLCIKVETHNSPSALDPYGGALTGILGVNRDILGCGIGAKPIANMDVFCLAHESMIENGVQLPYGLKHPKRILEGVHKGVEDGGNKSGIPTVNGSIFYDDDYAGKPLIYVGTVGAMPQKTDDYASSAQKEQKPKDKIVMVGGKIGADGIHGATFSSLELNESSPATAVQIGDPLTQKKVMDFMLKARDLGLYTSVTDNGAGGLSSSVGEMAEKTNGAIIDLAKAPTKYEGLSPYELMISESQERMTFAVDPAKIDKFQSLAKEFNVESSILGEFSNSGFLEVYYGEELVANLDLHFLHESLKPMELEAIFDPKQSTYNISYWHNKNLKQSSDLTIEQKIIKILQRPNISSKEDLVRQYDHEVQGATIVKPFTGELQDGPSDAGVVWLEPHGGNPESAIAISNGLQPLYSHQDSYLMAIASIDEAVRNCVCTGANPDQIVLLDNFCWPDPLKGKNNPDYAHKMAQLVRACEGLYDAATEYAMPFVSGKDSMKNDFTGKDKDKKDVKISVAPTLLITAMGKIDHTNHITTTDFKSVDDLILLIGAPPSKGVNFSEYSRCFETNITDKTTIEINKYLPLYKSLHQAISNGLIQSAHDISEGGLITALTESAIGGKKGFSIQTQHENLESFLFNESLGQVIISIKNNDLEEIKKFFNNDSLHLLGQVTKNYQAQINHCDQQYHLDMNKLELAWKNQTEDLL